MKAFTVFILTASFAISGCASNSPGSPQTILKAPEAAADTSSKPFDFIHEVSDLKPDESVIYGKLANGLRYAVMHNGTPSKTAALRVRFATGSLNESDAQQGLAHFLEHMAFNGTKNVPEGEMVKRLERFGLRFGADTNAHTGFDETVYKLNLPQVSEEMLDEAFFIMRETAENMTLAPDAIDRERGIVQSEKRARDSASHRAQLAQLDFFTGGSRLLERYPIGTDETLKTMQSELFETYYRNFYRPENTFVVLVGDIDPALAEQKIKDAFSDWQPVGEAGVHQEVGKADIKPGRTGYFFDPEIMTNVSITSLKPYEKHLDTAEHRKTHFIEGLGHRILNRRLSRLARASDAKFLSGQARGASLYETMDGVSLTMRSHPENWQQALAAGEQELRKALQYGFTQAELDEQIARSRTARAASARGADTRQTVSRFGGGLVTRVLNAFGSERIFTHPEESQQRFESYADTITTGEVWTVFKEQWSDIDNPLLYLETSTKVDNPQVAIRSVFQTSFAQKVAPPTLKNLSAFAYSDFGTPGKIASETHIEDIDAHLIKFENNVLLNFKQTDFAKDRVSIRIKVGDGPLSAPRKDETLRRLAFNVMAYGGYEAHSLDDVQTLMAGKAVGPGGFRVDIDTDAFTMRAGTIPSDIRDQLGLMAANIIAPGYRQEAMDRYHKGIAAWYPTHDGTVSGVLGREIPRLIRSGDERYGFPRDEKAFYEPTMQEVKDWLVPHLKGGLIDITIVGDIDKDTAIKAVAETFGTLNTRKATRASYPEMTKLKFPQSNDKPVSFTHEGDANRAVLRIYWPAPDGSDQMRSRRIQVLRAIFRNRVVDVIREEVAATYSPGVGLYADRAFEDYGYLFVTMDILPENISAMITKIHEIAADFQKMNISEDEFDRAIQPVLEGLDSTLERNGYWMRVLSDAQTDSWGIDNFRTREQAYKTMTLADIKPYAAKIFRRENAFHVQIVPSKAQ